jgi:hypothetical protein
LAKLLRELYRSGTEQQPPPEQEQLREANGCPAMSCYEALAGQSGRNISLVCQGRVTKYNRHKLLFAYCTIQSQLAACGVCIAYIYTPLCYGTLPRVPCMWAAGAPHSRTSRVLLTAIYECGAPRQRSTPLRRRRCAARCTTDPASLCSWRLGTPDYDKDHRQHHVRHPRHVEDLELAHVVPTNALTPARHPANVKCSSSRISGSKTPSQVSMFQGKDAPARRYISAAHCQATGVTAPATAHTPCSRS